MKSSLSRSVLIAGVEVLSTVADAKKTNHIREEARRGIDY